MATVRDLRGSARDYSRYSVKKLVLFREHANRARRQLVGPERAHRSAQTACAGSERPAGGSPLHRAEPSRGLVFRRSGGA